MNFKIIKYIIFIISGIILSSTAYSQLSLAEADYDEYILTYRDTFESDPVFVFYSPLENGQTVTSISGSLQASHSSNDTSTFIWLNFNTNTLEFDTIQIDSNLPVSFLNNLDLGCYRVEITDTSDSVETYTAWTHIDHISFNIRPDYKKNHICRIVDFTANYNFPPFYYYHIYDTLNPRLDSVNNESETIISIEVEGEPASEEVPAGAFAISTSKEDKNVYFRCTDLFQNKIEDYYFYETWLPDVEGELEDYHTGLPDEETDTYFATDEVTFYANGENYDSVIWLFGDTVTHFIDDSSFTTKLENTYKYIKPGKYTAKVIVKNDKYGCIDRDSVDFEIVESVIEIPGNTFTPVVDYGDVRDQSNGLNDYFIVKGKSIRNFNIKIFDRWGRIVYKNEITDFQPINENVDAEDKGVIIRWDGINTVAVPSRKCPTGVYFYIIEAEGWDGNKFNKNSEPPTESEDQNNPSSGTGKGDKKYPYTGTIYLFR